MLKELERDKSLQKITKEEKERIANAAIEFGVAVADWVRQQYGSPGSPAAVAGLAEKEGAVIKLVLQGRVPGVLAEYDEGSREIYCYVDAIEKLQHRLSSEMLLRFETNDLLSFTIAHEFFHHLENTRFGKTDSHIDSETRWFGLFRIRRPVRHSREIAAHAFVRSLLNLPDYPVLG